MCMCSFCFSSRRRHTRCALVTGVQTCALPIYPVFSKIAVRYTEGNAFGIRIVVAPLHLDADPLQDVQQILLGIGFPVAVLLSVEAREHAWHREIGRASCRERVCPYV